MTIPDLVNAMPTRSNNAVSVAGLNSKTSFRSANDVAGGADDPSFSDTLKTMIEDVNTLQLDSAKQSERFLKGEAVDIHGVMIASEKAKTTFQLLMEIRNKALDVYKEALRVQV